MMMSAAGASTTERAASLPQMTLDGLRQEYVQLMTAFYRLGLEEEEYNNRIEALRQESVRFQQNIEVEEECATNRLLRRLHGAERDVSVCRETVQEEEAAVKEMEEEIRAVRRQQAQIERQLEEKRDYQFGDLQKKLLSVAAQKRGVEHELQKEQQRYLDLLLRLLNTLRRWTEPTPGPPTSRSPSEPATTTTATTAARSSSTSARDKPTGSPDEATTDMVSQDETTSAPQPANPGGACKPQSQLQPATAAASTFSVVSARHTPRSGSEMHEKVVELEHRLNKLLQEQTAAVQKSIVNERRCAELAERLDYVQSDVFIKRAKAAKLKEDLNEARQQLDELGVGSGVVNGSFGEFSLGTTPNLSMDASGVGGVLSVRDRTKELLSAAAATQSQPVSARYERGTTAPVTHAHKSAMSVAHNKAWLPSPRSLLCTPHKNPPTDAPRRCGAPASGDAASASVAVARFRLLFPTTACETCTRLPTEEGAGMWREVIVPIAAPLSRVTVAELARVSTARIARAFPRLTAMHTIRCFAAPHPEWLAARPFQLPSIHTRAAPQHTTDDDDGAHTKRTPCWFIDTTMNAEDSLDNFFAAAPCATDVRTYDLVIVWQTRAEEEEGKTVGHGAATEDDQNVKCVHDKIDDTQNNIATAAVRLPAAHVSALHFTHAPVLPVVSLVQRSTYIDLLHAHQTQRQKGTIYTSLDDSISSDVIDDVLTSKEARAHHAARAALCESETSARDDVMQEEASVFATLCENERDGLRHVLTLEALKGDFVRDGQLAALLRRRRCYPVDTEPLVVRPSTSERAALARDSAETAELCYQYRDTVAARYDKDERRSADDEERAVAAPKSFRTLLSEAIEMEKKLEQEAQVRQWYIDAGLPVPPPPPPPPRTPMTVLPRAVVDELVAHYTENRRDLLRSERVAFRAMTRLMADVLVKQREKDRLSVRLAYEEEFALTDVFDLGAYVTANAMTRRGGGSGGASASSPVQADTQRASASPTMANRLPHGLSILSEKQSRHEDERMSSGDRSRRDRAREATAMIEFLHHQAFLPLSLRQHFRLLYTDERQQRAGVVDEQATAWAALLDAHKTWRLQQQLPHMTLYVK